MWWANRCQQSHAKKDTDRVDWLAAQQEAYERAAKKVYPGYGGSVQHGGGASSGLDRTSHQGPPVEVSDEDNEEEQHLLDEPDVEEEQDLEEDVEDEQDLEEEPQMPEQDDGYEEVWHEHDETPGCHFTNNINVKSKMLDNDIR